MTWTLGQLAERFDARLKGDAHFEVRGLCSLLPGVPDQLGFLADSKQLSALERTQAGALILHPEQADAYAGNALIASQPALLFAHVARLFDNANRFSPGVHPSAVVDASATVADSTWLGPGVVVEAGARIGEDCFIGSHCVIRAGAVIGDACRLESHVHFGRRCRLGQRGHILPGAVIGSRGFGNVQGDKGWEAVPQLGAVSLGDDVEVGANTSIDRGALDDTIIEDGVKLDNQIQIAHNCRIGAHTAIAACVGIAGSTVIGRRCMIGGAAGIGGHLVIADDVVILGRAMVTKSLSKAGVYGSGLPVMPVRQWHRLIGRIRRLDVLQRRLVDIEKALTGARKVSGDKGERKDQDAV